MTFKARAVAVALLAAHLTGAIAAQKKLDTALKTKKLAVPRRQLNQFDHEIDLFSGTITAKELDFVTTGEAGASTCPAPATIDTKSCGVTLDGGSYVLKNHMTCTGTIGLDITNGAVLDCDGKSITGDSQPDSTGVLLSSGAVLKNCIIHSFETGIHMQGNSIVGGGAITNSGLHGILVGVGDNKIVDAKVDGVSGPIVDSSVSETKTPSKGRGIEIYGDGNNIVSGAKVSNANSIGIYINGHGNNVVSCSTASNNGLDDSLTEDRDGLLIDGHGNNIVTDSTFSFNGGSGIYLWYAKGSSSLIGCTAKGNGDDGTDEYESGLVIEKSGDVFVSGGKYSENIKDGIFALETSGLISIEAVEASGNNRNGIHFSEALTEFRVMGSTMITNGLPGDASKHAAGIRIYDSTGTISCSTIEDNQGNGVQVDGEDDGAIVSILDSSVSNNIKNNIIVQAGTIPVSRVSACGSGDTFQDVKNAHIAAATIIFSSVNCEGANCDLDCSCPFELPNWCTSTC